MHLTARKLLEELQRPHGIPRRRAAKAAGKPWPEDSPNTGPRADQRSAPTRTAPRASALLAVMAIMAGAGNVNRRCR
jgi:hypothetical protein